jgi:hypothetical protein
MLGNQKMHRRLIARVTSISLVERTINKPSRAICTDGKVCKVQRRSQEVGRNEKNDEAKLSTRMA